MTAPVPRRVRARFRELLVGWTLREIDDLFDAEGFEPGVEPPGITGQRRGRVEQYYSNIDWESSSANARVLRIYEQILAAVPPGSDYDKIRAALERDGYTVDELGRIRVPGSDSLAATLSNRELPAGVRLQLDRILGSIDISPEEAIGAAKELVESVSKHALDIVGVKYDLKDDLPSLAHRVQEALSLNPGGVAPDKPGAQSIRRTLGSLTQMVVGVAELRNLYGTGHGRTERHSGLKRRHAMLAVGAAVTYSEFVLATIEAPDAPWRRDP